MPHRLIPIAATVLSASLLLLIFHHAIFQSYFDQVCGDSIDTLFNLAILEHWLQSLLGQENWLSPNFFYPATGTLGYSDALLLLTPPYLLARLAGASAFHALQITLLTMTLVGFAGMLFFLRRLKLVLPVALAGAVAFAGNTVLAHSLASGHVQLLATLWLPWLACLILSYLHAPTWNRRLPLGLGAAIGLATLLYTSFNTGWFITVQLLAIALVMSGTALRQRRLGVWRPMVREIAVNGWHWPLMAALFAVSLSPFLLTYLPVVKATGGRSYSEVAIGLPQLLDFIHPRFNWLWEPIASSLFPGLAERGGELGKGLPWGLLALFTFAMITAFFKRPPLSDDVRLQRRVVLTLGLSVLICWSLMVEIHHATLWRWVYQILPGAIGVRTVFRFNLVLVFSVITGAAIGLHWLWRHGGSQARWLLVLPLCLLMALEQINSFDNRLSQQQTIAPLLALPPAPATCRSFALLPTVTDPSISRFTYQNEAVILAQRNALPTVNGYSGMAPPLWSLADPADRIGYRVGLIDWADRNALWPGLCAVDPDRRTWTPLTRIDLIRQAGLILSPGARLGFTLADDSGHRFLKPGPGWGTPDAGGTWTTTPLARFEGLLTDWPEIEPPVSGRDRNPAPGIELAVTGSAFFGPQQADQTVMVMVNGTLIGQLVYHSGPPGPTTQTLRIPASTLGPSGELRLDFLSQNPQSPASVGTGPDTRTLGLLLAQLSFQPDPR